ncbi:MAG: undecaprenyldiphospho-muramoylpentapeptide beta-N-acetylglucosaminyltransferase [Paludibacteraceae bacterium]|nr:undecaprenyldiphospho-muramoylpentapeptide beta-N-acetylglucosaminyltransferase [Paludibacteraceae bacterium]HOK05230.1 undecaprenyldiphospho-muramoylpentapeptide beta-N-acetylglucosaminyltransferase [Victivallales bacterium]HPO67247.1 undecaprenyldiphospho-muramoylpentapeptide beta-N-acetylglucosaminyltransferase [Paludibacteraceae bacterium]
MSRFIISGGGTGGHIFPAISIANALKRLLPEADILFVGATGRMEMERVPAAGYSIEGLPISGLDRKNLFKNIKVLVNLFRSFIMARRIIHQFKPDVVVGVGGYASAPTLLAANILGIPTVIQEQNSYAGVTNKFLAKKASCICVAYEGMERFFPKDKIVLTGNPVRQELLFIEPKKKEAYEFFGFQPNKKTLLILGGSLGARTINESVISHLEELAQSDIQIIWQTGKYYLNEALKIAEKFLSPTFMITDFISRMDFAYAIADLVVSRAGASSISELSLLSKAAILVPSPNVAEDHQTKNALALVKKEAAIMIKDAEAKNTLIPRALEIINDENQLKKLSQNIKQFAHKDADELIAKEIISLIKT